MPSSTTGERSGSRRRGHARSELGVGLLLLLIVVLRGLGAGWTTAMLLTLAIAAQVAAGSLCWILLSEGETVSAVEGIAAGFAIGPGLAVVGAQLLRVPLGVHGWIVPSALVVASLGSSRVRRRVRSVTVVDALPSWRGCAGLVLAPALAAALLVPFWLRHPLRWTGRWAYDLDIGFHEALLRSVTTFGPGDSVFAVGDQVRYHWFTHAWMGAMAELSHAAPFVVLTRVAPIVALLGASTAAWALAQRISTVRWVPPLAAACVVLSGYVGSGPGSVMGTLLVPSWPSQSLTTGSLLLAVLVVVDLWSGRRGVGRSVLLLTGAGAFLAGGKVNQVAVLLAAIVVLVAADVRVHRRVRLRAASALLAPTGGAGIVFMALLSGSGGAGLRLGVTPSIAGRYGLEPSAARPWAVALGGALLVLAAVARWSGTIGIARLDDAAALGPLAIGLASAGLGAAVLLTHPGGSQEFFLLSASTVLVVVGAAGLGVAMEAVRPPARTVWTAAAGGAVVALVASALWVRPDLLSRMASLVGVSGDGPQRWVAMGPLAVWLGCAVVVVVVSKLQAGRVAGPPSGTRVVLLAVTIIAASIATPVGLALERAREYEADPTRFGAVSDERGAGLGWVEAGRWLHDHSRTDDVVLTNRLCSVVTETPPACDAWWSMAAATIGRRMWIEGYSAGSGRRVQVGERSTFVRRRVALAVRFTNAPDVSDHRRLWAAGVRWVWLDARIPAARRWRPFGRRAFANASVRIIRLHPPAV